MGGVSIVEGGVPTDFAEEVEEEEAVVEAEDVESLRW